MLSKSLVKYLNIKKKTQEIYIISKMTTVKEKASTFHDETSQEDTRSKTIESSEFDDFGIEDDIKMSANQDDNPMTMIITNI